MDANFDISKTEHCSSVKNSNYAQTKGKSRVNSKRLTIHASPTLSQRLYAPAKRIMDFLLALISMPFLLLIVLIVGMIIKLDSKGPVLFKHKRIGKKGKPFSIYKFRTMCDGAAELNKTLSNDELEEFLVNYKLEHDPRITKVGRFLRETSIDELPQLINVLLGQMSLVGPRPVVADELKENYGADADKFLSVRPGITGYWQVNGRNATTYEERKEMELYYVSHCSFWEDVKIVVKTFGAVIKKTGN